MKTETMTYAMTEDRKEMPAASMQPPSKNSYHLKERIIIKNVKPEICCGKYHVKRVIDEKMRIEADIFSDGHLDNEGYVLYRRSGHDIWSRKEMKSDGNDHFSCDLRFMEAGWFEYTIVGNINHFTTWQKDIAKKHDAAQDILPDLLTGAEFLTEALDQITETEKIALFPLLHSIQSRKTLQDAYQEITSADMAMLMKKYGIGQQEAMYEKTLRVEVEPRKALFSTWYEFFPRSASAEPGRHGTLQDATDLIPRIAAMGFDVTYLPPIHPIGTSHRKGRNNNTTAKPDEPGSPWAIGSEEGDHKSIHSGLGTFEDFDNLINEARKHGIEVALDIALQCSPDHPYVRQHPQWFKWRPDGTVQYAENPPKKYEDVLPFNFDNEDWLSLWMELKSIFEFWIEKGVRIFRVDNPHTKPFRFWEWLISDLKSRYSNLIFLSEAFTRPRIMEQMAHCGFTQSYTYFTWRPTRKDLMQYMQELTKTELREYFRPNFWPNTPDILPYHLQHADENKFLQRLILAATLSSSYGIYGPAFESGINQPIEGKEEYLDSEKYEIVTWNLRLENKITEGIRKINGIRKISPAMQQTSNIIFTECSNDELLCFLKWNDDETQCILTIINMDTNHTQTGFVKMPQRNLHPDSKNFRMHDLLTGQSYLWKDEWNYVELHPEGLNAHIFNIEIL
jgi:starch synthase (maltosyl-transferring)